MRNIDDLAAALGQPKTAPKIARPISLAKVWKVYQDNQEWGPYNDGEIRSMLADGSLRNDAQVWREGMSEWAPISAYFPPQLRHASPPSNQASSENSFTESYPALNNVKRKVAIAGIDRLAWVAVGALAIQAISILLPWIPFFGISLIGFLYGQLMLAGSLGMGAWLLSVILSKRKARNPSIATAAWSTMMATWAAMFIGQIFLPKDSPLSGFFNPGWGSWFCLLSGIAGTVSSSILLTKLSKSSKPVTIIIIAVIMGVVSWYVYRQCAEAYWDSKFHGVKEGFMAPLSSSLVQNTSHPLSVYPVDKSYGKILKMVNEQEAPITVRGVTYNGEYHVVWIVKNNKRLNFPIILTIGEEAYCFIDYAAKWAWKDIKSDNYEKKLIFADIDTDAGSFRERMP